MRGPRGAVHPTFSDFGDHDLFHNGVLDQELPVGVLAVDQSRRWLLCRVAMDAFYGNDMFNSKALMRGKERERKWVA